MFEGRPVRRRHAVSAALAAVLLGMIVIVAADGRAWASSSEAIGWSGRSVLLVAVAAAGVSWVALFGRLQGVRAGGLALRVGAVGLVGGLAAFASIAAAVFLWTHFHPGYPICHGCGGRSPFVAQPHFVGRAAAASGGGGSGGKHAPALPLEWALATAVVAAVFALVALVGAWRRRRLKTSDVAVEAVVRFVDESLDDLRREVDLRRAIEACYARMERTLVAVGLARAPAEAPYEFLGRLAERLRVEREPLESLTALFEEAKFSPHRMTERMRDVAIDALVALRAEAVATT